MPLPEVFEYEDNQMCNCDIIKKSPYTPKIPGDGHYKWMVERLLDGAVIPFLGAGVNRCGCDCNEEWKAFETLPLGRDLAKHLATYLAEHLSSDKPRLPKPPSDTEILANAENDLMRISQYILSIIDLSTLKTQLHKIFDKDYPPTKLHRFLASLAKILRAKEKPRQLIITTNYDDVLERAFKEAGEKYDVIFFQSQGIDRGRFMYCQSGHKPVPIPPPNKQSRMCNRNNADGDISLEKCTVILKIHGTVKRQQPSEGEDSYIITEDDYIDYMTNTDISSLLPHSISLTLQNSNFLFLAYSLRDWNIRLFLNRLQDLRREAGKKCKSVAIDKDPHPFDETVWDERFNIETYNVELYQYINELDRLLLRESESLPSRVCDL